jgi:hypothetical protein
VGVQIGALGHIVQEGIKGKRSLLAGLLEGFRGSGLAILRYGLRLGDGARRQAEQQRGGGDMEGPANWNTVSGHRARRLPVYSNCGLRP